MGASPAVCPGTAGAGPGGFTLGDFGHVGAAFNVHDDGEIWAETLWDLRRAVGTSAARGLVTNGMRLSPDNPSFLEARDGIIQAAEVARGGAHTDTGPEAGVRRAGWATRASTDGPRRRLSAIEAFDLPPGPLVPDARTVGAGDGDGTLEPGESFTLSQALRNIRATAMTGVTSVLSESRSERHAVADRLRLPERRRRRHADQHDAVRRLTLVHAPCGARSNSRCSHHGRGGSEDAHPATPDRRPGRLAGVHAEHARGDPR